MIQTRTILAVDDTTESLALLGQILSQAGYEVRLADGGDLALAAARAQPPDLILLDIRMPGIDGLEVCRRLKLTEATRQIPVILMSAFAEVKDWVEGFQAGAVDYITKPFQEVELLGRVRTHLALGQTAALREQATALLRAKAELEAEVRRRGEVEVRLRQALEDAERSRRELVDALQERQRAQVLLRQWADAFEHCAHGLALGDPQTNTVVACNPALARLLGRTVQDIPGSTILSLYAPEDHERLKGWIAEADRLGHVCYESSMVRADGSTFPVQMDVVSVRSRDGQPLYRVATAQDITERKRAEAQIRRQSGLIESLLDSIPDLISYKDLNGVYLGCNPAFAEFAGRPRPEIIGRTDQDLFPREAADFFRSHDRKMLETLTPRHNEEWLDYPDGRRVLVDTLRTPYRGPDGSLLGVLGVSRDITLRQQAEEALRESEGKFRMLAELVPQLVWACRPDGWNIYFNQRWVDYTGLTLDESHGHGWVKPFHPDDQQRAWDAWQQAVQHDTPYDLECRLRRADNTYRWFLIRGQPLRDTSGRILQWFGTCTDIDDRKQTELELERMKRILSEGQRIAHVGSFEYIAATGETVWSDEEFRIYGLEPGPRSPAYAELMARHFHPEDAALVDRTFRAALQARSVYELEHRIVRPDGSVRHLYDLAQPFLDRQGRLIRYVGATLDITDRKLAEESLRENEARLETLFEHSPVSIWEEDFSAVKQRLDALKAAGVQELAPYLRAHPEELARCADEVRVLRINETSARFFETRKEEVPRALPSYFTPASLVAFAEELAALAAGTRLWEGELPIRTPAGRDKDLFVSLAIVPDHEESWSRVIVSFSDITARKQAEEALRQRNEELVRFTYTVSHDLKSPLVTIRTFLGYLEKDLVAGDSVRIESDMTFIRRAAEKMLRMLEELLELSRVGRKVNPQEEVSLQTLAKEAQELVGGQIAEGRVRVRVTDWPLVLCGDRQRLLEVFQNLLDNAVKFMGDQPSPQVEIGAEATDRDIVLFVRDNGAGIDPRHQSKLFGLFEKLHPGTPGSGIGLALVKRIVEVHGGRIWVESAGPGQGATFRFTLKGTRQL